MLKRFVLILVFAALAVGFASRPFWRLVYPFPHRVAISREARLAGLDPRVVAAVIKVESNFAPMAISQKGAVGLMQVMPKTAQWVAKTNNWSLTNTQLFDPDTNIKIGTWYLGYLFRQFNGLTLAIAAYNGGRGNVAKWRAGLSTNKGFDYKRIPYLETRFFVQRVLFTYQFYRWLYSP